MTKRFYVLFAILLALNVCVSPIMYAQEGEFVSVCDRTEVVRGAILRALPDIDDCADVTAADLASIKLISLGSRDITTLNANDFKDLTSLEYLHLSSNALSSLPAGLFDDLTKLELFRLSYNALSSLPAGLFDNLTKLRWLYLEDNELRSLPDGLFDNLTKLIYLNLSDNELRSLPEGIFDNLTKLEYLLLSDNALSSVPAGLFDNLTKVKYFHLRNNESLSSLPEGIFDNLTKVKHLHLENNALSSLPDGLFKNLTKLERLRFNNNALSSLPADILGAGLTELTWLYLEDNALSSLPDGLLEGLTALRGLYLSGNTVDPLPVTVSLKQVGEGTFKATVPAGSPFDIVFPLRVSRYGRINGTRIITISTGTVESETVRVTRTPGREDAVWVNIGPLPNLPGPNTLPDGRRVNHSGYALVKSSDLPLTVIEGPGNGAPGIAAGVVLPDETTLSTNYPNPFNPETWIPYQLANPSDVVISIYDARGRVVRRLVLGHQPAGYYTNRSRAAYWDGRNNFGERVSSGFYFYQLKTDTMSLLRKMVILK